ncbi:MAG: 30S ribosomal protein S20 [Planctomycetota bacterium]
MPNTAQAVKRLRQDKSRNLRNRASKSEIKTLTKRLFAAVEAGDNATATNELQRLQARLDKAAKKGVMHKKTVDRRKSRLARAVASMGK